MQGDLPVTGDPAADRLLADDPLALLIGMLLDQQVPMEWAFRGPYDLKQRLGGRLDAAEIAGRDPEEFKTLFSERPALHRYPGSMAGRVQALCQTVVDEYGGQAAKLWKTAASGDELLARLKALPGFGPDKARIFVGVLGKRFGVTPPGWETAAADWASVADVDSPEALERVREAKKAMKAAKKAGG
jgi:uncharacterized HhH-GPD family protein